MHIHVLEEIWVKLNLGHKTVGSKKTLGPGKSLIGVLWMCFRVSERCLESVWKSGGGQVRTSQVTTGQVRTG